MDPEDPEIKGPDPKGYDLKCSDKKGPGWIHTVRSRAWNALEEYKIRVLKVRMLKRSDTKSSDAKGLYLPPPYPNKISVRSSPLN